MSNFNQFRIRIAAVLLPLCVLFATEAFAQRNSVTGTVVDAATREALVGVSVLVKGTPSGATTDAEGHYAVAAGSGDVLLFSYVGYAEAEETVGSRTAIDVALAENAADINQVVVIGYGTTTRKELTGAVTNVTRDEFNAGTFSDAMGLLQGKVAGLSVVNGSGADPNATFDILLRGANTLKAGQGPLLIVDGVAGEDIRNINFQEVETVDVLKDGSAAAIYGVRGSNGVIIITTRRARMGQTAVEYDGQVSTQVVTRRARPLSAAEYTDVIRQYRPELATNIYGGDTDWFDQITRTPVSHKHALSVSGGSERFSHRTVLNYEGNQGIQRHNDASKILLKTNIRQSILEGWVDLDYNLHLIHRKYTPAVRDAFRQAFTHNPTEPVYDPDNAESGGWSRIAAMEYYNPVAMIEERDCSNEVDDYAGNIRATLNILPVEGLKWDNFLALRREATEERAYYTRYYPSRIGQDGHGSIAHYQFNDLQWESTLSYQRQFDLHSLQVLAGYTYQNSFSTSSSMTNGGFDTDDWLTNNMGAGALLPNGTAEMDSYKERNKYIAFFGRVMYNYRQKYLFSASFRADGSSRFGVNNKWAYFPAVSVGWRLSGENFLRDAAWIDDLKIRAGFGQTGNQDIGNYQSLMMMGVAGKFFYNGKWINTYAPVSNANPDLAWEKKSEFNVGLDFVVLGNRLSITADYYLRRTSDLFYDYAVPTPPYVYGTLFTNVGKVENQGFELTVAAVPVKTPHFEWNSTFTLSHNTNKLVELTNDEFPNADYKVGWSSGAAAYTQRLIEGQSLGTFYGPIWLGTDTDGADVLLGQDENGSVPEEQWVKIGCAYPDVVLGWSNTFRYKEWDLGFTLRASLGGDALNGYAMEYENLSSIGLRNISAGWLDHTDFTSTTYKYSSKYVEDASFLKLDNITLGWSHRFDSKFVKRLRLSFTAQNVFCITGYSGVDPELALTGLAPGLESLSYYPRTAVFTFGANLTF